MPIAHSVQFTPVRQEVIGCIADPLDRRLFHGVHPARQPLAPKALSD